MTNMVMLNNITRWFGWQALNTIGFKAMIKRHANTEEIKSRYNQLEKIAKEQNIFS